MLTRSRLVLIVALLLVLSAEGTYFLQRPATPQATVSTAPLPATSTAPQTAKNDAVVSPKAAPHSSAVVAASPAVQTASALIPTAEQKIEGQAVRIDNPYPNSPLPLNDVYARIYPALVNIMCLSHGKLASVSGSGVIIDPRGVVLTNAHVAQYVLLSEDPDLKLSCSIRRGSPADGTMSATVLYIPPVWVQDHAHEIISTQTITGTGDHDYAFLLIRDTNGASFSSVSIDTREAIGFLNDDVVAASYPAEFAFKASFDHLLYPDASPTTITQLLTFGSGSVDLISVGGVVEAQSGSSGGVIVNPWGYLIGLITTTSGSGAVDTRELHALTLSYINRDLQAQTGQDLSAFVEGDLEAKQAAFQNQQFPSLMQLYLNQIRSQ